ncbi:MAG: acylphosphatase [Archaeoglobaceae archaeon]|nr:acylphosphatase [Archaeoglobaceae archaeon]
MMVEIYVEGVVQGVGFRYFTQRIAKEIGIKGFVKNLPDGRVYIVAEGSKEQLDKFMSYVKKGPSTSIVRKVTMKKMNKKEKFDNFEIVF